jgi:Derlin-2/3
VANKSSYYQQIINMHQQYKSLLMIAYASVLLVTVSARSISQLPSFIRIQNNKLQLEDDRVVSVLSSIRGGAFDDDTDDDDYDFDDSDFDFDDDAMFDFDAAEDDFGDDNTLTQMIDAYHKTPPLTKAYLTASFGAALLGYVSNKNDFPSILQLDWKPILTKLQIWRPLTAFLNFGPLGLGYLMTAHFVWTYMSTLERLNHSNPYDFWLMMLFGSVMMVGGYTMLGLSPRFLGHNLSTFLVYVWSRYHEGLEVNMFELFNTRAELLPWFFLGQTFLLEGEVPTLDFLGIVFGHIYHHYKTTNVLRTPRFVIQWYNGDNKYAKMLREKYKDISSDFEM